MLYFCIHAGSFEHAKKEFSLPFISHCVTMKLNMCIAMFKILKKTPFQISVLFLSLLIQQGKKQFTLKALYACIESIRSVDTLINTHKDHTDLNVYIVAGQMTHSHIMNVIKDSIPYTAIAHNESKAWCRISQHLFCCLKRIWLICFKSIL